jgi:hypothetical protein
MANDIEQHHQTLKAMSILETSEHDASFRGINSIFRWIGFNIMELPPDAETDSALGRIASCFHRNPSWVATESMVKPYTSQLSVLQIPADKLTYIATHLEAREQVLNSLPSNTFSAILGHNLPDLLLHVENRILPGLIKVSAYLDGRSVASQTLLPLGFIDFRPTEYLHDGSIEIMTIQQDLVRKSDLNHFPNPQISSRQTQRIYEDIRRLINTGRSNNLSEYAPRSPAIEELIVFSATAAFLLYSDQPLPQNIDIPNPQETYWGHDNSTTAQLILTRILKREFQVKNASDPRFSELIRLCYSPTAIEIPQIVDILTRRIPEDQRDMANRMINQHEGVNRDVLYALVELTRDYTQTFYPYIHTFTDVSNQLAVPWGRRITMDAITKIPYFHDVLLTIRPTDNLFKN